MRGRANTGALGTRFTCGHARAQAVIKTGFAGTYRSRLGLIELKASAKDVGTRDFCTAIRHRTFKVSAQNGHCINSGEQTYEAEQCRPVQFRAGRPGRFPMA